MRKLISTPSPAATLAGRIDRSLIVKVAGVGSEGGIGVGRSSGAGAGAGSGAGTGVAGAGLMPVQPLSPTAIARMRVTIIALVSFISVLP